MIIDMAKKIETAVATYKRINSNEAEAIGTRPGRSITKERQVRYSITWRVSKFVLCHNPDNRHQSQHRRPVVGLGLAVAAPCIERVIHHEAVLEHFEVVVKGLR